MVILSPGATLRSRIRAWDPPRGFSRGGHGKRCPCSENHSPGGRSRCPRTVCPATCGVSDHSRVPSVLCGSLPSPTPVLAILGPEPGSRHGAQPRPALCLEGPAASQCSRPSCLSLAQHCRARAAPPQPAPLSGSGEEPGRAVIRAHEGAGRLPGTRRVHSQSRGKSRQKGRERAPWLSVRPVFQRCWGLAGGQGDV